MAIIIFVNNFSNFNVMNICFMAFNERGKDLMAIILVMAFKPVNAYVLKHYKRENNGSVYFNGHYYMHSV